MGNRKIVIKSDHGDGDTVGPYREATANDILVDGTGVPIFQAATVPYCLIYWTDKPPATTVMTNGKWKKIAGNTSETNGSGFDNATTNNRIKYTGSTTEHVSILASVSGQSSANNTVTKYAIAFNGVIISSSIAARDYSNANTVGNCSVINISNMSTNDYVELWARTNKNATLTTDSSSILVRRV
jgi:hypothetical protein